MNVCFSSWFLAVGLFLSSSALTPEECQPLVAPLSLDNPVKPPEPFRNSVRFNFISGYNDQKLFKFLLKIMDSSWLNISASKPNGLVVSEESRMNGTCFKSTTNITFSGNAATTSRDNETIVFHMLPSCDDCLLLSIKGTANVGKLLALMKLKSSEEVITVRALNLLAKRSTVTDAEIERFKQQAKCLGFSGEPDFHYNPDKEFCREGESIPSPLS